MGGGYFVFLSQADSHQSISHGGQCDRCGLSWLVGDVMARSDVTAAPTPPGTTPENRHYFWALHFKKYQNITPNMLHIYISFTVTLKMSLIART